MDQKESLKILEELNQKLDNMSDEEKEKLKRDIDDFCNKEEPEESKEENELRRNFLKVIL